MSVQTVGEAIAECRERFGIARVELAAHAGLPVDQLRRFEAGLERPQPAEVELLARGFECASRAPAEARRALLAHLRPVEPAG